MEYIIKLATPQSQKPRSPSPNHNVTCGQLKFLLYTKYCWQALGQNVQSCKVPVNSYLYFHLLIFVCPKTIQVYIYCMAMKIFENSFPLYEDLQNFGSLFTSYITPHITLGKWVMPNTLAWSLQHWREVQSPYISGCQIIDMFKGSRQWESRGVWSVPICPNLARTAAIEVGFSLNFAVVFDFIYFRFRPCKAKWLGIVLPNRQNAAISFFFSSFIMRIAYWRCESVRVLRQCAANCKKSPRNTNCKLKTLQYCCALPNGARWSLRQYNII